MLPKLLDKMEPMAFAVPYEIPLLSSTDLTDDFQSMISRP